MSIFTAAAAALLATAAPETVTREQGAKSDQPAVEKSTKNKVEDFDPAVLFTMFDKLFPPQPDPAPERLALSRVAVQGLFPDGSYVRMMDGMMNGLVDRVLDMSAADFGTKGKDGKAPSALNLRQEMAKDDPHFEERMKIIRRVLSEEMVKVGAIVEPKMRDGLARAMAHRFDARQLADLNAFLATDSGRAYGRHSLAMWFDSDVMRGMFAAMPELITVLPASFARLEAATAHLPKPKKSEAKAEDKKKK